MKDNWFLLEDRLKQIGSSFSKDGWVTIYESIHTNDDQCLIFCCLVDHKTKNNYLKDRDWGVSPGHEGKPSIISTYSKGKEITKYHTFSEKGIEPFIFIKHFSFENQTDKYIDVSEEFILYFKLYEKQENKQNRKYYFIDEIGDLEEGIKIEKNKVSIKKKFLMEYISIRKMHLSICFDFMRFIKPTENEIIESIDKDYISKNTNYNHYIREVDFVEKNKFQSWVHGKTLIEYDKSKTQNFYFDLKDEKYESFITGYDETGNEALESCEKTNEKAFKLTYFKKTVLDKYYNDPSKYTVDGWHVKSKYFSLKIDNNVENYIPVFLTELSMLPFKEQLHWKQYNIHPQNGISNAYFTTMIEGNWVDHPETPDLFFKYKYEDFNKKWETKFGWKFYKKLALEDEHYYTSLHLPTSNNVKTFCEQILALVKLTIDRLNEGEFKKEILIDTGDKSIAKLEKFLKSKGFDQRQMIEFIRNLQDLRSGLIAHSFSNSNKDCKRSIQYFNLKEDNYVAVAKDIFIKSIWTMNSLEKHFNLEK